MAVLREIRTKARQVMPPVIGACLVGYFAYHVVQGDRGLRALQEVRQDLTKARATEAKLADKRARLDRRVSLLRPDGLDPDMLAERAHLLLNFGRDDEYVILLPKGRAGDE
jgi:cell division protein FtsB